MFKGVTKIGSFKMKSLFTNGGTNNDIIGHDAKNVIDI
jgi:hypothetical protein